MSERGRDRDREGERGIQRERERERERGERERVKEREKASKRARCVQVGRVWCRHIEDTRKVLTHLRHQGSVVTFETPGKWQHS